MLIGADPGKSGGLATLCPLTGAVSVFRLPLIEIARPGKSAKSRIDPCSLGTLCRTLSDMGATRAILEQVHGYGGQGGAPSFTFGRSTGILEACLAMAGIEVCEVAPSVWKPRLGVPSDKGGARARATEILGVNLWPLEKDDGLAEAALLAYYGHKFALQLAAPLPFQVDYSVMKKRRPGRRR